MKNLKNKLMMVISAASIAVMSSPIFASDSGDTIKTAFSTAATQIKSEVLGYIPIAVTAGLAIVGATIGIKKGIVFLKTMVNKA